MLSTLSVMCSCRVTSLSAVGSKFEIRCAHARTNGHTNNAFPWSVKRHNTLTQLSWDLKKLHCGGGNLFWHGCNEFQFYGLYRFQPTDYTILFANCLVSCWKGTSSMYCVLLRNDKRLEFPWRSGVNIENFSLHVQLEIHPLNNW